jgi:PmbA protein
MTSQIRAGHLMEELTGQVGGAELYELRGLSTPVRFQAGALESVKLVETTGRALRLIHEGRLGFSTTTDLADDKVFVQNALQSAQFGGSASFDFPERQSAEPVACFDAEVEQMNAADLIALGEEIVEKLRAHDPELQIDVSVSNDVEEITLLNTSGLEVEHRRTYLSVGMDVIRTRGDDITILWESSSSHAAGEIDPTAMVERLLERLRWSETIASVESGAMPVVFSSMATLCLLLPLSAGLNGRTVYEGASPLGEKLGQQVLDPRFTFLDDGRLDFATFSAPYDDEGTPTARKALVEDGVVRQFLYDLKTAAQAGAQPTGNGFKMQGFGDRGFHLPPAISPTTRMVLPGDRNLGEMLRGLDEAILVEGVIGLGQGNVLSGEFSNNVSTGFLVRNGEMVGRVKNTMIAGNVYELLKDQLIGLSDRPEWVFGMLNTPAIAVDGVGVASQG